MQSTWKDARQAAQAHKRRTSLERAVYKKSSGSQAAHSAIDVPNSKGVPRQRQTPEPALSGQTIKLLKNRL